MLMLEDVTLSRTFGDEVGRWFEQVLRDHGIEIFGGEELEAFEGDGDVGAVVTKGGRTVEGDMVVVGAGVRPDTMLAERAGLEVDNGIICDARARELGARDLRRRRRLLLRQRRSTAAGCGSSTGTSPCSRAVTRPRRCWAPTDPYREVPYFFSDLADWASFESVGPADEWDEVVWSAATSTGASSAPGI